MSNIVETVARWMVGFILLFGAYIVIYGHITPGGGFAGGVVLASGFILVVLALGRDAAMKLMRESAPTVWDCLGALAFLALAVAGYASGGFFLNFLGKGEPFHLFSGGAIPLYNLAIGIKVGACLFGVFLALAAFRFIPKGGASQ